MNYLGVLGFLFSMFLSGSINANDVQKNFTLEKVSYQIDDVEFSLVLIPSGRVSNSSLEEERQVGEPNFVASFYMMEAEVTWQLYQVCIDANVCDDANEVDFNYGWNTPQRPVFNVSWIDVTEKFIPWINSYLGLTGEYSLKLPTQIQWHYAAKSGTSTLYSWGDNIDCSLAQFDGGKSSQCPYRKLPFYRLRGPAKVKSYSPNNWGLYDMSGNVWEWVADCGINALEKSCKYHVITGGSWFDRAEDITSSSSYQSLFSLREYITGFRLIQIKSTSRTNKLLNPSIRLTDY